MSPRPNEHDNAPTPHASGARTTLGQPTTVADTVADRREFLTSGLQPVHCGSCGACVFVKKNSHKHTSIQWTSEAAASCPVLAEPTSTVEQAAPLKTCDRLTETIHQAVRDGLVEVPDD